MARKIIIKPFLSWPVPTLSLGLTGPSSRRTSVRRMRVSFQGPIRDFRLELERRISGIHTASMATEAVE